MNLLSFYLYSLLFFNALGMYTYYKDGLHLKYPRFFESLLIIGFYAFVTLFWPLILIVVLVNYLKKSKEGDEENG